VAWRWWGVSFAAAMIVGCGRPSSSSTGQVLRVAIHTEPQSWNRLLAADHVTVLVTDQLHEPLIRLDPETQEMEPALAESWAFSEDGRRLVMHLRKGVRFSDGVPFTSSDVVFTFRALYDGRVASPLRDTALIQGAPIEPEVVDESTVAFVLPRRTGTIERIFDSIPMLPAHVLETSLAEGTLPSATGLGAPIPTVVGLGPFALREYVPRERIVLERNPYYWMSGPGRTYPRLDRMVFQIVPDENARLLRLETGETDLVELLTPEAFERLDGGKTPDVSARDLGPSLVSERLWFNLDPGAPIAAEKKKWFEDVRFRRAISMAIDRRGMARVVFSGRASPARGPVSEANSFWHDPSLPEVPCDREAARALLKEAGFAWSPAGKLEDPEGHPVRFTMITNSGSTQHTRMGAFIQQDLEAIGIDAHSAPMEAPDLMARLTGSHDYEAMILGITATDPDPSAEMGLWMSNAPLHLWHPGEATPATPWEARIDALMELQMAAVDLDERRDAYSEVQRIISSELPVLDLVVPHLLMAARRNVQGLRPTPLAVHALWNAEEVFIAERGEKTTWGIGDSGH
jgi:peptide/nickel transport system substrate-binding protein